MPELLTRADSIREYLTGASSEGGTQASPSLSLGNYRSSTEVTCLGIAIANAITNVTVDFASAENGVGTGTLTAPTTGRLAWTPPGSSAGPSVDFSGAGDTAIVEGGAAPGKFLRVTGSPPFSVGASQITLSDLFNNFHGFDNVTVAQAGTGVTQYRAVIIKNMSANDVESFQRCIAALGTARTSNTAWLTGSGAGTVTSTGSLDDWPDQGYAQVRSSGGTLKEVVYYSSRTGNSLTVPAAGRALLGTSATAGANTDVITPVPGIAIGVDTAGVVNAGTPIQTVADQTTAPAAVTWNLGITAATGLQIGTIAVGKQVGVWVRRHIPAGIQATPGMKYKVSDRFIGY